MLIVTMIVAGLLCTGPINGDPVGEPGMQHWEDANGLDGNGGTHRRDFAPDETGDQSGPHGPMDGGEKSFDSPFIETDDCGVWVYPNGFDLSDWFICVTDFEDVGLYPAGDGTQCDTVIQLNPNGQSPLYVSLVGYVADCTPTNDEVGTFDSIKAMYR